MKDSNTNFCFTEEQEILFYDSFKKIQPYGCTYLYFTIIDKNLGRIRFSTDENWLNVYLEEGLLNDDPMKAASEQSISRILPWKHVSITCKSEKKVMQARSSFNIYNGINFISSHNNTHQVLTLCTNTPSHDLPKEILTQPSLIKELSSTFFNAL